jgi:hypothetical protein
MSTKKERKSANYAVGRGRPPVETRFQPGKSGNPNGRPKGTRTVGAILQDVIQQKTAVTVNGKELMVPAIEGALRRLASDALGGDNAAMKLLLALIDRYGVSPEMAVTLGDLIAEDQQILARYLLTRDSQQSASSDASVPPATELKPDAGGDDDNV